MCYYFFHPFRSLRQYLESVMLSKQHPPKYVVNKNVRNTFMKKVTHRIYEDAFRVPPVEWGIKPFRMDLHICEFPLSPKAFCHALRIAILTAGTHLGTPGDGVPGNITPGYSVFTLECDCAPPLYFYGTSSILVLHRVDSDRHILLRGHTHDDLDEQIHRRHSPRMTNHSA